MAELTETREVVRDRYAQAAKAASESEQGCCGTFAGCGESGVFGGGLYDDETRADAPAAAVQASLGCGVPTAVGTPQPREAATAVSGAASASADSYRAPPKT